jgi:hypothetical protein
MLGKLTQIGKSLLGFVIVNITKSQGESKWNKLRFSQF